MNKNLFALSILAALSCSSHAFVFPSPPPGFGGSPGQWTVAPSPGDTVVDRVLRQSKALPVPGSAGQKVGVAYRLGNAAGRIAAAAIYISPHVRTAVGIAAWLGAAAFVYNEVTGKWEKSVESEDVFQTDLVFWTPLDNVVDGIPSQYHSSPESACSKAVGMLGGDVTQVTDGSCRYRKIIDGKEYGPYTLDVRSKRLQCPAGTKPTSGGCKVIGPKFEPVPEEEFIRDLPLKPMPSTVPQELPYPTPLPVESPSPSVNPSPGANPTSQPWRVPIGNPQPNPNYDPDAPASPTNQPYRQPYVDYIPSPTTDQPWRLDTKPGYRYLPTPQGMTDPITIEPGDDPANKPTEDEKKDLCEKHPNIVACEDGEIVDVALPPIPTLYERKYPQGLTRIWNEKSQQIMQSSTFTLAAQLMPTGLTTGSCPSWVIPLQFASWASFGEHDFAPPCWLWDVAKTIIIISALMLARSLIFGG